MSVKALTWAWKQALSPMEKLTLLALADHSDDDGRSCYPSNRKIAEKSGITERSIPRIVKRLKKKGLLETHPRFQNGRQTSNNYRLFLTKKAGEGDTGSPQNPVTGGDTGGGGGATPLPPTGATREGGEGRHRCPPDEPSSKPSNEPASNRQDLTAVKIKRLAAQIKDFEVTLEKNNLPEKHRAGIKAKLRALEEELAEVRRRAG